MGPAAYDLASLLQDARVDVPELMEVALLGRYVAGAREADADFDAGRLHPALRHAGGAARLENPRHLRPARPARRQAAISATHAARMGLSAALAGASGAGDAAGLVQPERAGVEAGLTAAANARETHAMADRSRAPPWCSPPASAAHAAADRPHAEAAGAGRAARPLIDHVLDRLADGRRRARGGQRALPRRPDRTPSRRRGSAPRIVISDERGEAARHRRRRGQGAAAARRRAVLPRQLRHDLDRRREAQPRAARRGVRSGAAWTRCCCWRRPRPASAMPAAAISPWRRTAGCTRRAEREVAPFVYAGAAILRARAVQGRAGGRIFADHAVRPRGRGRAGCTACGSKACGCMSARPRRSPQAEAAIAASAA